MDEHFHHEFWVVAGTAAPVIIVALVLTIADLSRAQDDAAAEKGPSKTRSRIAGGLLVLSLADISFMLAALLNSLNSLAAGTDQGGLSRTKFFLFGGLLLLLIAAAGAAGLRFPRSFFGESGDGKASTDDRPPSDADDKPSSGAA